jgi:hypothetical protein
MKASIAVLACLLTAVSYISATPLNTTAVSNISATPINATGAADVCFSK